MYSIVRARSTSQHGELHALTETLPTAVGLFAAAMNLAPLPVATSGVWPGPLCSVTPRAKGGDSDTDTLPWRECTWVKKAGHGTQPSACEQGALVR